MALVAARAAVTPRAVTRTSRGGRPPRSTLGSPSLVTTRPRSS